MHSIDSSIQLELIPFPQNSSINRSSSEITHVSLSVLGTSTSAPGTINLRARAAILYRSIQNLLDEDTRNKICILLRAAFTVALIVGGTFAVIATGGIPLAAVALGFAIFFAYAAICVYNGHRIGLHLTSNYVEMFFALIAGPIFPIVELFQQNEQHENKA